MTHDINESLEVDVKDDLLKVCARAEALGGGLIGHVAALKEFDEKSFPKDLAMLRYYYNTVSTKAYKDEGFEMVKSLLELFEEAKSESWAAEAAHDEHALNEGEAWEGDDEAWLKEFDLRLARKRKAQWRFDDLLRARPFKTRSEAEA